MESATITATSIGDIMGMAMSFRRQLRGRNVSPTTVATYGEAVQQLSAFLAAQGMPMDVVKITREHVESFIEKLLGRWKPATASNRFRALQQFFGFLVDEGEITASPMAKMKPPIIPENPPGILREKELKALLEACEGASFEDRRDAAIIRVFIDTGARLGEVRGLRWTPNDPETNDVDLDGDVLRVLGKGRR